MTPTLHFIKHCGKMWLVGIDGKDIQSIRTSGDDIDGVPFMSVGFGELEQAHALKERYPCRECKELVEVKEAKTYET